MRLRPVSVALAFLLLLLLAYTAWWASAAAQLRERVERWADDARAGGAEVSWSALEVTGFPLQLRAVLRSPVWRSADGLAWTGTVATAAAEPWNPFTIALTFQGAQRLALPAAGPRPELFLDAMGGDGTLSLNHDGRLSSLDLRLGRTGLSGAGAPLSAESVALGLRPPASASLAVAGLRGIEGGPLGTEIARAALELRLTGPVPADLQRSSLAAWSAAGGTVEVERLSLDWGPLEASGDATLALDGALQPQGAGALRLDDPAALVDGLVAAGLLPADQKRVASTVLSMLGTVDGGDGRTLRLPVTLQDRGLYLGPVRLVRLPEITWE